MSEKKLGKTVADRVNIPSRSAELSAPIPMYLTCPKCNARHVDIGEFATKVHHTHSCQSCGLTRRPAAVATVGVEFLPGFKDADEKPSANTCNGMECATGCIYSKIAEKTPLAPVPRGYAHDCPAIGGGHWYPDPRVTHCPGCGAPYETTPASAADDADPCPFTERDVSNAVAWLYRENERRKAEHAAMSKRDVEIRGSLSDLYARIAHDCAELETHDRLLTDAANAAEELAMNVQSIVERVNELGSAVKLPKKPHLVPRDSPLWAESVEDAIYALAAARGGK